jgi:hypothetical protein
VAKKRPTEEQTSRVLRQAESAARVGDICHEHGVSETTYYIWKRNDLTGEFLYTPGSRAWSSPWENG